MGTIRSFATRPALAVLAPLALLLSFSWATWSASSDISVSPRSLPRRLAAPRVTITPANGTLFSGAGTTQSLPVQVHVCSDGIVSGSSTRTILFRGSNVTASFDGGEQPEILDDDCFTELVFSGTVTLQVGSNLFGFEITDNQGTTQAQATWGYTNTSYSVSVTPDAGSASFVASGYARTAVFTVSNPGATQVTYTTSVACTGQATQCSGPPTVTVPASGSASVPVSYVGSTTGSGKIRLLASVATFASDSGWINTTASAGTAGPVTVVADTTLRYPAASLPQNAVFTVTNTGTAGTTVSLSATCTGSGVLSSPCETSAASVTIGAGESRVVGVRYTSGSTASATGTVTLTAGSVSGALNVVVKAQPAATAALLADTLGVFARGMCLTVSVGDGVAYECGDLRLVHPVPATKLVNRDRGFSLLYNTAFALPTPGVALHVKPKVGTSPDSFAAVLSIGGTSRATGKWGGWGTQTEKRIMLAFQETSAASGFYDYTVEVTQRDAGVWSTNTTVTGKLLIVNRVSSPFGRGWWLSGVEQLALPTAADTTTIPWIGGDGSAKLYRRVSPGRWVATAVTRPDTLKRDTAAANAGGFMRDLPGGARVGYNTVGRHVYTRDRMGHVTWFRWSGTQLQRIVLPGPLGRDSAHVYTFEYNAPGSRLSRIVAPYVSTAGDRNVNLNVNASGEVTRITDPDGLYDSLRYTTSLLDRLVNERNKTTDYTYESLNRLVRTRLVMAGGDSIAYRFSPAETKGKHGLVAYDLPSVYTLINGPRDEATDVSDQSRVYLDRWSAPVKIVNPLNDTTTIVRGDPRFPGLVTRSLTPSAETTGYVESSATYDLRGRLVATTVYNPLGDNANVTTLHEYGDASWPDFATRSTSPTGLVSMTGYDASGNRVWQQATGDSARRVRFGYNADGQVTSVRSRAAEIRSEAAQTVAYDTLTGNAASMTSPLGVRSFTLRDRIGRDTASLAPIDSAQTKFQEQRTRYDVMSRVTETQAIGPAVTLGAHPLMGSYALGTSVPLSNVWVRNHYTAGALDSTSRWSTPDTADIGTITTRWRYDNAGRAVAEISPDGYRDSTVYNPAGGVVETHTRRGHVVRMTYDVLGRLTRRITPAVTYADTTTTVYTYSSDRNTWVFPRFRPDANGNHTVLNVAGGTTGGVTIPVDTANFTYDRVGNVRSANNRDAKTARGYYRGGALKADTQQVRNWASATFGHTYVIGYTYDAEGRLTKVTHPGNVAPTATTDVDYNYSSTTGELTSVVDEGGTHDFDYDVEGRLTSLDAYGTVESYGYDADGRQVAERRVRSALTWKQDSIVYDVRAKQVRVMSLRDTVVNDYTGLGALARSIRTSRPSGIGAGPSANEESYVMDALGNNVKVRQYSQSLTIDASNAQPWATFNVYQAGTGRLTAAGSRYETDTLPPTALETHAFDVAGNRTKFHTQNYVAYPEHYFGAENNLAWQVEQSRSYYGADGKLRVLDRRACAYGSTTQGGTIVCLSPAAHARPTFEEYRYDALGRRVLTRTEQDFACANNCIDGVTRTVWDGDQVLYEIRRPIDDVETDTGVVDLGTPFPHQYGRVGYTHGGGIDKPLAIYRMDYDTLFPTKQIVAPHTDSRGAYEAGTHFAAGMSMPCVTLPQVDADAQGYPSDDPENPPAPHADSVQVCVKLDFPAAKQWMSYKPRNTSAVGNYAWWGSLIAGGRDASGQMYMRNRYYDPGTGRFTQEDPIGIAGGLNLYGFVGGDPVNFSDPYGLCPDSLKAADDSCPGGLSQWQYNTLESGARNSTTGIGQELFLTMLERGEIVRVGRIPRSPDPAGADYTYNRILVTDAFFEGKTEGELAFLTLHEMGHLVQYNTGMLVSSLGKGIEPNHDFIMSLFRARDRKSLDHLLLQNDANVLACAFSTDPGNYIDRCR